MSYREHHYIKGDPWMICDKCNFKRRRSVMRKDWQGFMVCPDDFDLRPSTLGPRKVFPDEGKPIPDARPPGNPLFLNSDLDNGEGSLS